MSPAEVLNRATVRAFGTHVAAAQWSPGQAYEMFGMRVNDDDRALVAAILRIRANGCLP